VLDGRAKGLDRYGLCRGRKLSDAGQLVFRDPREGNERVCRLVDGKADWIIVSCLDIRGRPDR
jgi:hypothetical protein